MERLRKVLHGAWSIVAGLGGLCIVGLVLLASVKSCVVAPWQPPAESQAFRIVGEDARTLYLVLRPNHRVILALYDDSGIEASLAEWKGTYGSHLVSRLWHIAGPGVRFGYRVYPAGFRPVMMEMTTLRNFKMGTGDSAFPSEGERGYEVVLIGDGQIIFDGMPLQRFVMPKDFLDGLLQVVGHRP